MGTPLQREIIARLKLDPTDFKTGYDTARQMQASAHAEMLGLDAQRQRMRGQLEQDFTSQQRAQIAQRIADLRSELAQEVGAMSGKNAAEKAALSEAASATRAQLQLELGKLDTYNQLIAKLGEVSKAYRDQSAIAKEASSAASIFKSQGGGPENPFAQILESMSALSPGLASIQQRLGGVLNAIVALGGGVQVGAGELNSMGVAAASTGAGFETLTGITLGGVAAFALFTAGTVAVGGAMLAAGLSAGKWAMDLDILSQRTGVSVSDLKGLELAGKVTGVTLESLIMATRGLSKAIVDGSPILKAYGIEAVDPVTGAYKNESDVLLQLAGVMEKLPDGAEKIRLSQEIALRGGQNLIPALNLGTEALKKFFDMGAKEGPENMKALSDAFKDSELASGHLELALKNLEARFGFSMGIWATAKMGLSDFINEANKMPMFPIPAESYEAVGGLEGVQGAPDTGPEGALAKVLGYRPPVPALTRSVPIAGQVVPESDALVAARAKLAEASQKDLAIGAQIVSQQGVLNGLKAKDAELSAKISAPDTGVAANLEIQKELAKVIDSEAAAKSKLVELEKQRTTSANELANKQLALAEAIKQADTAEFERKQKLLTLSQQYANALTDQAAVQAALPSALTVRDASVARAAAPGATPKQQDQAKTAVEDVSKLEARGASDAEVIKRITDEYAKQNVELDKLSEKESQLVGRQMDEYSTLGKVLLVDQQRAKALQDQLDLQIKVQGLELQRSSQVAAGDIGGAETTGSALVVAEEALAAATERVNTLKTQQLELAKALAKEAKDALLQPAVDVSSQATLTKAKLTTKVITPESAVQEYQQELQQLRALQASAVDYYNALDQGSATYDADQANALEMLKKIQEAEKEVGTSMQEAVKQSGLGELTNLMGGLLDIVGKFGDGFGKGFTQAAAGLKATMTGMQSLSAEMSGLKANQADTGGALDLLGPKTDMWSGIKDLFSKDVPTQDKMAIGGAIMAGLGESVKAASGGQGVAGIFSSAMGLGAAGFAVGGPIGAAVGAGVGAIAGGLGMMKDSKRAQSLETVKDIEESMRVTMANLQLRLIDLQTAIAQLQQERNQLIASDTGTGKKGNDPQVQQALQSINAQIDSLQAQQKQTLDQFTQTIAMFQVPVGIQQYAQTLQQITTTLQAAAGAGADASQQAQYLNAALSALAVTVGDKLNSAEMDTINLMQRSVDLAKQRAQIVTTEAQQEQAIRAGLGLAPVLTPGQQAEVQVRNLRQQRDIQLQQIDEQQANLKAQLDGQMQLFGWTQKDLDATNAKTLLLNQQLILQKQITAETVAAIQAQMVYFASLAAGQVPALPLGLLPTAPATAGTLPSSFTIQTPQIVIQYSGAASADDLAAALKQALFDINVGRGMGLSP